MRVKIGLIGLLIGLAACAGDLPRAGNAQTATPNTAVADFLGNDIADIVAKADRVESLRLESRAGAGGESVQGYPVRGRGPDLSAAQVERLRGLIFAESSYLFGPNKRCPFVAETGFVFHAGARQASVVLSPGCKLWSFGQGAERPKIEDYDPVEDKLNALTAELLGVSK